MTSPLTLCLTTGLLAAVVSAAEPTAVRPPYHLVMETTNSKSAGIAQTLDCYDYANSGGDRVSAIDYIPALAAYNFDNRISSCCFTGVWLLYANEDYNEFNAGAANWWAYGNNYCTNVPGAFDNVASSLRFTGAPDGWEYDVLNLYFKDFFIGGEEFLYNDMAQLNYDNQAQSIIVTGCSGWTIYQYSNYQGNSMCVWPANTGACYPGFYTTAASLGSLAGQVSSARKGCFSARSVLPENHISDADLLLLAKGKKGEEGGVSGFFPARPANAA